MLASAGPNEALLATIATDVSRAFGPGATVTGGPSRPEDLALPARNPIATTRRVRLAAIAKTTYAIPGATGDDIDLALASAAPPT